MTDEVTQRLGRLTPRQRDCLRLIPRFITAKAIAIELGLSPETVKTHTNAAMRTLGVSDRHVAARLLAEAEEQVAAAPAASPRTLITSEAAPVEEELTEPPLPPHPRWISPPEGIESPVVSVTKPLSVDLPQPQESPVVGNMLREPPVSFPAFDAPPPSGFPAGRGAGRRLNNDLGRRLMIVLAWVLGAPTAMAVLILLYVAATNIRFH